MKTNRSTRILILTWLAWAVILIAYQDMVQARFQPQLPDNVLDWTGLETGLYSHKDQPYLLEPFLNNQVAWDSEFYLSISTYGGYDDPTVRTDPHSGLSLNYAFFPFYPFLMRIVSFPLRLLGLTPIATSTLAGVLVSTLGALAGMIALASLARPELGDSGALRTAFYLIIFPTGFYLAQVYTEGLFAGLAFSCLAFLYKKKWVLAAACGVLATWTRAVGVLLVIPLVWSFYKEGAWREWSGSHIELLSSDTLRLVGKALLPLAPVIAYFIWQRSSLGQGFKLVEDNYFHRGALDIPLSILLWVRGFESMFGHNPERAVYYGIEFGAILLSLAACWRTFKRYPDLAVYSLAVILVSVTSGPAQGMHRYILAAPVVFLWLGRLGENEVFDRAWTLVSILLMGLLAMLFTFNMWVA